MAESRPLTVRAGADGVRAFLGVLCVVALGCTMIALPFALSGPVAAASPSGALEIFLHPVHGGQWSSHLLRGVRSGAGAPRLAAEASGQLVVVQRTSSGDVMIAQGSASSTLVSTDLTASLGVPTAAATPAIATPASGGVSLWYRTENGDLEVLSQASVDAPWVATDVTTQVNGPQLAGDPTVVVAAGMAVTAYAVTLGGSVARYTAPSGPTSWTVSDPTNGLAFVPLAGSLGVFAAPGAPAATDLLGTTASGNLVELTNELSGPRGGVGPWRSIDLTALGTPAAAGPVSFGGPTLPVAAYRTSTSGVIALTLDNSPGTVTSTDLSASSGADPAPNAQPLVVASPLGAAVQVRSVEGDLTLYPIARPGTSSNVSFQPSTGELVAADPGATVFAGTFVLVAADAGPIAATALQRRIALLATSFDQQHKMVVETPPGSECNPFSFAFGRGSSWGCKAGTSAEEWCSDFAQWVWQTAGVSTAGISGWSASFITWGADHHRVQFGTHVTPQVGDAIVWGTRDPLYGTHVGIIVAVVGNEIDMVSGNSYGDLPGYGDGVWRTGLFVGSSSSVNGYRVVGVVTP